MHLLHQNLYQVTGIEKNCEPVRDRKNVSLCGEEVVAGVQVHRVVNIK